MDQLWLQQLEASSLDQSTIDEIATTAEVSARTVFRHFAGHDDWASPDKARGIDKQMKTLGKPFDLHVYEGAGHAFMRDSDKTKYHEPSATKAWSRTTAFLREHLG